MIGREDYIFAVGLEFAARQIERQVCCFAANSCRAEISRSCVDHFMCQSGEIIECRHRVVCNQECHEVLAGQFAQFGHDTPE